MDTLDMHVLQTERLTLREMDAGDAPFILEQLTDPSFLQNIGDRGVHDLDSALPYIERWQANYARDGYGLWLVERRDTREPVGLCGLVRRDTLPGPDIGYSLLPRFRGLGYAREACAAVRDHAFNALGLPRLLAIVSPGNADSAKVLDRIGLRLQGRVQLSEGAEELELYALDA